jgi:hypothetical protein
VRPRLEVSSNTSTIALRLVGVDEKGTQCLGVQLGHPDAGGYKYGNLALQVGGVFKFKAVGSKNYCAGEDQQQL